MEGKLDEKTSAEVGRDLIATIVSSYVKHHWVSANEPISPIDREVDASVGIHPIHGMPSAEHLPLPARRVAEEAAVQWSIKCALLLRAPDIML
jgi:hypothetical protein